MLPAAGYQAAAEERWVHDGTAVNAILELRGLKVVSLQHNLVTVPYPGLLLDRLHQPGI